jgi:NAD+ synthase
MDADTRLARESLKLDAAAETERIVAGLRRSVGRRMHRLGGVVGISGGVDSAVVFALAVRAFGPDRVAAIIMPEKDSNPASERLARQLANQFGVTPILENITPILEGFGCYERRDQAVRRVFPEYDAARGYRMKITLPPNLLDEGGLNVFSLTVVTPEGKALSKPLPSRDFLQIVAASNFKQRTRMAMLYFHAELRNYAVVGTANKNEHDQGFLVKYGDGGVDVKAIGHLYKTQVYQLAEHLGVPMEIRERPPTSDTYSAPCDQEEFFFRLPFEMMDVLWFSQEQQLPVAEVAEATGLMEAQVQRAFADFTRKRRTTEYLRMPPLSIE